MATHFERQLEELHVQMITMGSLCEKVISLSNRAIRGENCVREIFETDKEIDTKEREIENHCMRILLHQQPVARDLREVSAALKMISDMERIGDQAADIADLSQFIEMLLQCISHQISLCSHLSGSGFPAILFWRSLPFLFRSLLHLTGPCESCCGS